MTSEMRESGHLQGALLIAAATLANVGFLHWIWRHVHNWGIWDWDFQAALMEAARTSIVDFGQLPLWNPWMGGGGSLIGNPMSSTFSPSFLPMLAFGTVLGFKICILIYLLIAQIGTYLLARRIRLDRMPAVLAALVFSWGGAFAQHLAHGHIGWIGYAWVPFILVALHGCTDRLRLSTVGAGGLFLALSWLDGGAYHYLFVPLFVGIYAAVLSVQERTLRPLAAVALVGGVALGLAAVEIVPVAEAVFLHPRKTLAVNNYYGAPFVPTAIDLFYQAFLSRDQAHRPEAWMPFILNVGSYVGLLPLLLAGVGVALRPVRIGPIAISFALMLLVCLGGTLPIDLWALLHQLPGFDSMMVPMRLRILPLLCLAILAGAGLQALIRSGWLTKAGGGVAVGVIGWVAIDLFLVNAPIFKVAYSTPPMEIEPRSDFVHHDLSPYREIYERTALYPLWPNVPTAIFPAVLENAGIAREGFPTSWPHRAYPFDHPHYPGAEIISVGPGSELLSHTFTPNRLSFSVRGEGGTVVINQNYWPGWKVVSGKSRLVYSHQGLLGVLLPAGEQTLVIEFFPTSFYVGASLTLATLLGLGGLMIWSQRRAHASSVVS
ncbi:MAG: hypothetical protein GY946_31295 [bacterium]|nr:hypothetical protein [bacterium]